MNKIFKNKKIVGILGIIIVLVSIGFIIFTAIDKKEPVFEDDKTEETEKKEEEKEEEKKEITIIDVNSNSRPIAVMINNKAEARSVQSGLQDAYIVYEMIVEGGITRMMAVFKDKETARIGSVRSVRSYYLDYALENDARQISLSAAGVDLSTGAYTDAGKVSASSSKQISMTGKTGLVTEAITGETVASVVVTVSPSLETSWENATDATIVAMVEAADAGQIDLSDFWNVGDEREVMLSAMAAGTVAEAHDAQTVTMVLLNDGGRTLADGNECNFVVGLKDVLNTGGIPNEEVTTVGGWGASTRRAWCNNEFYNAIPDSLRPIFKQFYNPTSEGQGSSAIVETLDYFTLPSASEVLTEITAAFSGEGSILEYYANGYGVKYCAGSPLWYWLRSPDVAGYYYVHVYYPGYSEPGDEIGPGGISPHGCI